MTLRKTNQETYAILFKHLLDGPMTAYDLVEESGVHIVTAQSLMRCLKKHKVVHICGWEKNSRGIDTTPIYKLGHGKNKPRAKMTDKERTQRYRDKKKAMELQNIIVWRKNELPALST